MKSRNPVVAALTVIVALGVLAMVFFVGMILLTVLAAAGVLVGTGLVIRHKLRHPRHEMANTAAARARLDPSMEVRPEQELLPPPSSRHNGA